VTPHNHRLMTDAPPFSAEDPVTLANWQAPPFNRWAFQHVRELIPTARISRGSGPAWLLPRYERNLGGVEFVTEHFGRLTLDELLDATYTDGFLVIHQGRIVTERYAGGLRPDAPHLLMSVSKSVTGLIAGALAGQELLDVTAPVEAIVPELAGTAFAGALVQHLLDMRAGIRFREDYDDPAAEIAVSDQVYGWRPGGGTPRPAAAHEYFATLAAEGPHGAEFRYRSVLIDVLAWVLEKAGRARFADLVERLLWQPMGAEHDADITLDAHGNALADGGISATLRDAGRLGLLALRRGRANGNQVIESYWLDDTVRGALDGAAAFKAGDGASGYPGGAHYRNGWWVGDPGLPAFSAVGLNGQLVFVHGPSETVVVKLSSWPTALSVPLRKATLAAVTAIIQELSARQLAGPGGTCYSLFTFRQAPAPARFAAVPRQVPKAGCGQGRRP
jgi:CubicO group peptidase (beta-lactamase class C family)